MDLDATLKALETRADATAEIKAQATDLRKAIQTVFEERHRLDRILEKNAGEHGGTGYDLDAARSEIGRRLARLRAAQAADGVSEGAG
jgi:precorrin-6x reductase